MKGSANSSNARPRPWTRLPKLALTFAICVLAATSCATGAPATRDPPPTSRPPPPPPPPLQANQRATCPPLPLPESDRALVLLANHDQVAALYHGCAAQNEALRLAADEWMTTAWRWYCGAVQSMGLAADGCREK